MCILESIGFLVGIVVIIVLINIRMREYEKRINELIGYDKDEDDFITGKINEEDFR